MGASPNPCFFNTYPMKPESQGYVYVGHGVVDGVGADDREEENGRADLMVGEIHQPGHEFDPEDPGQDDEQVGEEVAGEDGIDQLFPVASSSWAGASPWIRKAPIMTAVTELPGIPRVSSGTMAPPVAALLAVSGAAMPSIDSGSELLRVLGPAHGLACSRKRPPSLPRLREGFR